MSDETDHKRLRRRIGAAGLAAGLALGGYGIASATSGGSTATTTSQTATTPAYGVGAQGTPARHFWGFRRRPPELAAAAKALDMTPSALATQLRSGKSIADVAKAKGVDPQTVIDAIVADVKSRLAARVKAGDITQAQADDFATDLPTRVAAFVNGTRPPGAPPFFQRFRGRPPELATAAKALDITPSALVTQLRSGKSIADVAKAKGIDPQTVIDAIVADVKSRLADRVKAGDITQAQADGVTADLSSRVTAFVNGTRPAGVPRAPWIGGPPGPGAPPGLGPFGP